MAGNAAGLSGHYGAGVFDDPHRVWPVFQALFVRCAVAGGAGVLCGRRHVPDGTCLSEKLYGRMPGGRGDRAGLYRVLGLRRQRYGGAGRRLGSHAGMGLFGRGDLQYAGAGGAGQGCRPRGAGDVRDVKSCVIQLRN